MSIKPRGTPTAPPRPPAPPTRRSSPQAPRPSRRDIIHFISGRLLILFGTTLFAGAVGCAGGLYTSLSKLPDVGSLQRYVPPETTKIFDAHGHLWVGDVGWELWEMIFRVEKGGNYGWSLMEGPQPVRTEGQRGPTPILPPAAAHSHIESRSITGGLVYRGKNLPELRGTYIYGDYVTGKIWSLPFDPQTKSPRP